MRSSLYAALERQNPSGPLAAEAQGAALPPQLSVRGIEQTINKKAPRHNKATAGSLHCAARRLDIFERELDLVLCQIGESRVCRAGAPRE